MTRIEFPKQQDLDLEDEAPSLAELSGQARRLAEELPGPLRRIVLRAGSLRVDVEWEGAPPPAPMLASPAYPAPYPPLTAVPVAAVPVRPGPAATVGETAVPVAAPAAAPAANLVPVTAPLVGTFYRAPTPGAEPFVKVGDVVEPGQTLAIIEAMKLLNNITAEHRARVVAVHVDNGDVVEFAQPLLDLEPVE